MRAGLYVRVSTAHQDSGHQLRALKEYCDRQGWTVAQVYDDSGVSGTKTRREGLDAMLDDVAHKRLDVVVTWKLDRMGRSVPHLLQVLTEIQSAGCAFVATTQQVDTTSPHGRMVVTMLAAIAAFERELTVERVKSGIASYREKNPEKGWGRKRVGLDIPRALKLRSQGLGYKQIAKKLNVPRTTLYRTLSAIPHTPPAKAA